MYTVPLERMLDMIKRKCFKVPFFAGLVCIVGLLSGCEMHENEIILTIPELGNVGGYEIVTDNVHCKVYSDGESRCSKFESKSDQHIIEFYAGKTESILLDTSNSVTMQYSQSYDKAQEPFANPLASIYEKLRKLEFKWVEEKDGYNVFQAIKTELISDEKQIDYTKYTLKMIWKDGKEYIFSYYSYVDGAMLISAEAPREINPLLTKDTKWMVDIKKGAVKNIATEETVAFEITDITSGKALSPNGSTETIEKISYLNVYTDVKTGAIIKMQIIDGNGNLGAMIHILSESEIIKPEITNDMLPMDDSTYQMALMLISMIESLIQF